ncbi:hypothetical protein TNCV_756311 [Trichonephila clavipes]|nr:hypothetical protein TNCV_756311 [Trichonephila clavipes]
MSFDPHLLTLKEDSVPCGRTSFENGPREGRPKPAMTPKIMGKVHYIVLDDRSGLYGKRRKKWDDKMRVENREGSLGYPGFVTPVFTKDSKPLGKRKRSLGHLGIVTSVHT